MTRSYIFNKFINSNLGLIKFNIFIYGFNHYFHYIPLLSSPYSTTTFTIFYQPTFIIIINDPIDVFTEAQLSIPPNNTSFNNTFSLYNSIYLQTHQNNELTTNICQDNERILYKKKVFITW